MSEQQFDLFSHQAALPEESPQATSSPYSQFVVYVDESGDHGLQNLDPNYPLFVLAFCVFHKRYYAEQVAPALQKFKFNHFGHDMVVLHETEIRKETGVFRFPSRQHKVDFLNELTGIIEFSNFVLISCVIDKSKLHGKTAENPYHIALGFCLETLYELMEEKQQHNSKTHVLVECRGKKEDADLELEFRRICDGANRKGISLPFDIVFANKQVNSAGLQLADLVARPIGLSILRPDQPNRAFDVLKRKFYCSGGRQAVGCGYENWGLKIYPPLESEKPR